MSAFSDMIASLHRRYQFLHFDLEEMQDEYLCRKELSIPTGEEIIAFGCSNKNYLDFSTDGIVLTDGGVYVHPSHTSLFQVNFISYAELCNYLFFHETSMDSIQAISSNRDFILYKPSAGRKNEVGRELLELLRIFQKNLKEINPSLKTAYAGALVAALGKIRVGFSENGILSIKNEQLLNLIDVEDIFPIDVAYIKAENYYRNCDMAAYFSYIDSLPGKVNEDLIRRLRCPDEVFFEEYIRDISNPYAYFLTQELIIPYTNLKKHSNWNLFEAIILSYLAIRMEDFVILSYLLNRFSKEMGEKRLWEIKSFQAKYQNEKMSHVYNNLLSNKPVSLIELNWQDSLGFTPLHYALMLRNWTEVEALLEMKDWSDYVCPYPQDSELKQVYDFSFITTLLYQNPDYQQKIFLATSKLAKPIRRSMDQLQKMIFINREMGREDLVQEYSSTLSELEDEIVSLAEYTANKARHSAFMIRSTGSPFAKTLIHICEKKDSIFSILTGTVADWRIYRFGQRFFVTTFDEELPFSYYEWMNQVYTSKRILNQDDIYIWSTEEQIHYDDLYQKKSEEKRTYRKYSFFGKEDDISYDESLSWFSDEARTNMNQLKKEYRMLVKKYHPDNANEDTTLIMQKIMTERADILSGMK